MTDKEYALVEKYLKKKYGNDWVDFIDIEGRAYLDGLSDGRKEAIEWHDLRKDPTDLPKETKDYIIYHEDNTGFHHYSIRRFSHNYFECTNNIIAWCELPQFKENSK